MMPKRRMSLFRGGGAAAAAMGEGGGWVRGQRCVCEGGRLKGEERKRPGEMGAGV